VAKEVPLGRPGAFCELLDLELVEAANGTSRCELTVRPDMLNPNRMLHGGVAYSMADTSMGAAVYTVMEPSENCATVEIKIVYFKAVRDGQLTCRSRVVKRGQGVAMLESEITNDGIMVASATGTFAILK
jgi:uncharacterized protein (TIGR00369 family)